MISRRSFIQSASIFTMGGLLANKFEKANALVPNVSVSQVTTVKKVIGLQICSLGDELNEDIPSGLKKLKQMGYSTLELAGTAGVSLKDFKRMSDDAGLQILSTHEGPDDKIYTKDNFEKIKDYWKKTADQYAGIGLKYIVQASMPRPRSEEEAKFVCEVFNEAGKILEEHGLVYAYHNHHIEFARVVPGGKEPTFPFGFAEDLGTPIYDIYLQNTDPSLVGFEMDVFWVVMGQGDPVEYMQQYPKHIKLLHVKDNKILGKSGMINFESIFKQFYINGFKDYFVELERVPSGNGRRFEGVKECCDYLLKAPFVK